MIKNPKNSKNNQLKMMSECHENVRGITLKRTLTEYNKRNKR